MKKFLITLISAICILGGFSFAENYTTEQQDAYNYAYSQKITTISSIEKADMNGSLTRIAMAKMISNFAINVLGLQPDTSRNCTFSDVSESLDFDYNYGVTQACQMGLMGIGNDGKKSDKFNPYGTVTRAQFATVFSRALSKYNADTVKEGNPYYQTHLQYLYSKGIIKSIANPDPKSEEKRGNVMLMLYRVKQSIIDYEDDNLIGGFQQPSVDEMSIEDIFYQYYIDNRLKIRKATYDADKVIVQTELFTNKISSVTGGETLKLIITLIRKGNGLYVSDIKVVGQPAFSNILKNYVSNGNVTFEAMIPYIDEQISMWYDITPDNLDDSTETIKFQNDYFETDDNQFQNISVENLAKLMDKGVIRGPKDAKITIVEFTELLCPYCQRQSQQGIITSVIQQFSGQVNSISRPFIIHGETALQLSSALECVGELKPKAYYEVLDEAFGAYPVNMTGLVDIAVKNGVSEKSLQKCIDEGRYEQFIEDIEKLGLTLGVNGTPTSIIIDNETGRYAFVKGAYPIETFIETIESLLD